jgi:hypothetical protein
VVAPEIKIEAPVRNPYVGPKPFEIYEQNLFFGRDWEAEQLTALVVAHPAVLLYAQSGAGKSSLLNAKVIPMLELDEGCEVLPVARVRGDIPPEIELEQITNRYIFNTLLSWIELRELEPDELVDCTLAQFLRLLPRQGDEEGYPELRVLVFDQFEELFTFYPERWPEREGFFQQVNEALAADAFLRVLFVIREDYLAQLDAYAGQLPEQLRPRFRLERLRAEAALAAVEGPLKETHRSFATGVAQELVDELLKIRVEGPGGQMIERVGEFVEPVQLQVVCQSLWTELPPDVTQITSEHLRAFGNIDQALTRFYERAIRDTVEVSGNIPLYVEWRLRKWFEEEAITPAGTRGLVYRGSRKTGTITNEEVNVLESHHIIRGERRAGARWYELTHDRFISPIQKSNIAWRVAQLKRWGKIIGVTVAAVILILIALPFILGGSSTLLAELAEAREAAQMQAARASAVAATATAAATRISATSTAAIAEVKATSTAALEAAAEIQATTTAVVEEAMATTTAVAQTVRKERVRPLRAGLSIGGQNATAGTLGYFVVDEAGQLYILSVTDVLGYVLANRVLQPGPFDGGQMPADVVGRLAQRLPLTIGPVPVAHLTALAVLDAGIEIEAAVPNRGPLLGVRPPEVGMQVRKLGRSTGWTQGQITAVDQTVSLNLGNGQTVQVRGAARAELESSPGDDGALVVDEEGYVIGILVATLPTGREAYLAPIPAILESFGVQLLPPTIQIEDISGVLPQHPDQQYPQRDISEIQQIVVHHTVVSAPIQRIAAGLVDRENLPGITYHYCITEQGLVYQTQPIDIAVFHSGRQPSPKSIDVCLVGDFTNQPPSQVQLNTAAILIAYLVQEYGLSPDKIVGYREIAANESPGATWESWRGELLAKVRDLLQRGVSVTVVIPEAGN